MKLSLEDVRKVAALARLSLTPAEEERYLGQLSAILEAVQQLGELDTTNVEPTAHASSGETVLRPDVREPSLTPEKSLRNAPAKVGTSFAVPRILE